jgi:hypothetical protein
MVEGIKFCIKRGITDWEVIKGGGVRELGRGGDEGRGRREGREWGRNQ